MPNRKSAAFAVVMGAIALTNVMRNPRWESIHTVDALQLVAAGMCFGVALAAFVWRAKASS